MVLHVSHEAGYVQVAYYKLYKPANVIPRCFHLHFQRCVWFNLHVKSMHKYYSLQGVLILFFHVIRSEMVWSKISQWFTIIRHRTLSTILRSQKSEVVS